VKKHFFRFSRKNINLAKQFFRFFGKLFKTILQNNFAKQFSNLGSQNANFGKTIFQNDTKQFLKQCFFLEVENGPQKRPKNLKLAQRLCNPSNLVQLMDYIKSSN